MRDPILRSMGLVAALLLSAGALHAATITVTSTGDSGAGTLRDAILTANGNGQPDVIDFAPALTGQTITVLAALPNLVATDTLIDGDIDNNCSPDVNLSGASAGSNATGISISASATNTAIRGLAIHSFSSSAIFAGANNVTIDCNHIGTDTGGVAVLAIGTANRESISISGSNAIVGPGNLVVNGRGAGIRVADSQTAAYPDFVGLTSDATPRIYAAIDFAESCGSFSGSGFTPVDAGGHPFTDNFGMRLRGRATVAIAGVYTFNFSGVDDAARLRIDGAVVGDVTGQSAPLTANLASGAHTIEIDFRENAGASRLQPNFSGPGAISLTTDDQALCATGQPGLCAELFQTRVPHVGNKITRNRVHDNAGLGIALGLCGPYANDANDFDIGPNTLLNTPVLATLTSLGGGDYNLTGTAPASSVVEVFQAANDASGFGEGASYLGQATATAGGNFSLVVQIAPQGALTATATDAAGDTSEFAKNFAYSTGATALVAIARSASSIELDWRDPNLGETAFRIERSTDGTSFGTVTSVGGNTATFTDTGLSAATLYYYRVVATIASGDAPASNRATASTFPASAAKVCFTRTDRSTAFALGPALDFDGSAWAMAWSERSAGSDNLDLLFRRFDASTLAPLAPSQPVTTADMNVSAGPLMAWNGTHHGLVWYESVRGAAGSDVRTPLFFALLDVNGQRVRGNVRIDAPSQPFGNQLLVWDGSHWGLIGIFSDSDTTTTLYTDVYLVRLNEDGSSSGAPVLLTATAQVSEGPVGAAWNATQGQYGIAFVRGNDTSYEVLFQRFGATGAPIDVAPVVLDSFTPPSGEFGFGQIAVAWDGTNWAVSWNRDDPTSLVESPVYLRRVDGATGLALGAGPTRLSDDPLDDSSVVALLPKPGGGYAAFVNTTGTTVVPGGVQLEIARMQADAAGARAGSRVYVSPDDGVPSIRAAVAGNGTKFLVAYGLGVSGALPNEINGVLLDASGSGAVPAPVALTSGHDAGGADIPRTILAAPLGAGFVGAWTDGLLSPQRINARIWNGAGQIVSTLTPLTATASRGGLALTSVGNTFALAWKSTANNGDLIFARYNASGGSITGEKVVAAATGGGNVALGWSGESYALFYQVSGGSRFLRVDDAGNAIGLPVATVRPPDNSGAIQWVGDGWVLLTRAGVPSSGELDYVHFAPDGTLLDGPTAVVTPLYPFRGARTQSLAFTGHELAASWTDWRGLDPPSEDVYFTALNRDGSAKFAPIPAISTGLGDNNSRLYAAGDDFRLIANFYGNHAGLHEITLTPAGATIGAPRFLSNRSSGIGAVATAFNGVTLGTHYFPSNLSHLYFHTDACLVDPSPPPCPALTTSFAAGAVQAGWSAVSDPESGVIRYVLYRDGLPLAETDADVLSFADGGYGLASSYEVRALNGAFVESAGCAAQIANIDALFRDGFE
jgi:hypothetical protein